MAFYKIILALSAIFAIGHQLIFRKLSFLGFFIIIIAILELFIAKYFAYKFRDNRIVYTVISYISILFYLIYFRIKKNSKKRYIVYLSILIFWHLFAIWNIIWGEGVENVNINTYNLGMIISSLLVLYWFYHKLYIDEFEQLFNNPKLYVGFGILIFYTCSFTILNFINYLIVDDNFKMIYSDLLKIGNIFLSLGYFGAILCSIRKTYYTI